MCSWEFELVFSGLHTCILGSLNFRSREFEVEFLGVLTSVFESLK